MSSVQTLSALGAMSAEAILKQARLRRDVLVAMLKGLHDAPTVPHAIEVLRSHAGMLRELGLHDEHARLQAFARAVLVDVQRIQGEADALEPAISPEPK